MNNTEKLYELAKVEKKSHCDYTCNSRYLCSTNCTHYNEKIEEFPPFTDTKQLNLIKWISLNTRYMWNYMGQTAKNTWVLAIDYSQIFKFKSSEHKDFSQALAGLACELWEDLSDEQREEVRGILR